MCVYTSVKSLPLVYISLTSTLVPVLTAIISYFHLRKGLNGIDIGVLAVSFVGVIVLIMGATDDSEEVEESVPAYSLPQASLIIPIIALVIQPFIGAMIPIMSWKIRSLHEYTISSYTSLSMFFLYGILVVSVPGQGFEYLSNFMTFDWAVVGGLGISSSCVQIFRAKSA